ncbi:hypothetical protein S40293_02606 [Stachybotrys chartarum IBT 40293]|nr:hypothetical protein S40293_02606 [Stachybotrys chartarum IBT 40293]
MHAWKKTSVSVEEPPFTVFTRNGLRRLRLLLGLAAITSPLTATIYFPLLPLLRQQFGTSAQAINLTLTVYIVFQAISPVIFGPFSDSYGRRPVFLFTLALYMVGNIGLAANQDNYAALLIFRAVQSLGASAAYAISFGVVADVCVPSERGRMLGPISMALNLGACVGPIVGGFVAFANGNHVWVFWSLVIVAGMLFIAVGLFLPETARSLVGSGSDRKLFKWWQLSWLQVLLGQYLDRKAEVPAEADIPRETINEPETHGKLTVSGMVWMNMVTCFRIIFYKDAFLSLWLHGSFYTVDYSFVATVPDIFLDIYGYNEWQIGLAYLPRGVGIIVGSYCTGGLMDYNYKATATKHGVSQDKVKGEDMLNFPIERARSQSSYWMLIMSTGTTVGYGWAVTRSAHPAVPLVLQFIQGFWGTYFYTTFSTLLVDTFPECPSTAAAATSVTRCAMAAGGVAILQPLLDVTGRGWYFTVLGLWSGLSGVGAVAMLRSRGMAWRRKRNGAGQVES